MKQILVSHLLADKILSVVKSMAKQFVHAYQDSLELLRLADLNVSQAMNVHKTKHVTIKSVEIPVPEHVALMLNVKLSTTIQFVVVLRDTLVILS